MKRVVRLGLALLTVAGAALVSAPAAHANTDLGRVDFGCDVTADDIYGDLTIVGSTVFVTGAVGDVFTIDEDNSDDCPVLNRYGQAVNTIADLGGFVSESGQYDSLYTNPLRYADSNTVEYIINGPGTFRIQALDNTYYTIVVNGGGSDATDGPNLTVWQQAVGRASADATCVDGYTASWAYWPNGGTGGWVCYKDIYAYYPDRAVY